MLPFLFIFSVADVAICFYTFDENECPEGFTPFPTYDFDKFKQTKFEDNEYVFFFTESMLSTSIIDFSNIISDNLTVIMTSINLLEPLDKVYLDFSQGKTFKSLQISNLDIHSVSNVNSKFSYFRMKYSRLQNLSTITAGRVDIDTMALLNVSKIISDDFLFTLKSDKILNPIQLSSENPEAAVAEFQLTTNFTVSEIDTAFQFDDKVSFDFQKTNFKEIKISLNSTTNPTLSFQAVSRSSTTSFPPVNFSIGPQNTLRFVNSNFPANGRLFATVTGSSAIVELQNSFAPFSIDAENLTVKLNAPTVSLLGPLYVRDTIKILSASETSLRLSSVVLASKEKPLYFTSEGQISVHIDHITSSSNGTSCRFGGEAATYEVSHFPETEIFSADFANLVVTNKTKYVLNYVLGESSYISAGSIKGSDRIQLVANFIGNLPTDSDVEGHLGEELVLFSKSGISVDVTFPRYNVKGFDSATHVYSDASNATHAAIKLDHHLGDFNNYLCINGTTDKCPEGSLVFADAASFDSGWQSHLRETAEDIYFYFRSQYGKVVNFTSFIKNGNHPHVYFESAILILDQDYIQGELGPITVNGSSKQTQIVINRHASPVMLISPLEFYNVMIAAHSIETINCTFLPYLKADPQSLAKYPQKCAPEFLVLENFDNYSNFVFKNMSVKLEGDQEGLNELEILTTDERRPLVNLSTKAKSVTFSNSEGGSNVLWPTFSHFEMTAPQPTLVSNLTADSFDGTVNVHNFDGLLKVTSHDGKVPLNFVNALNLSIESEANVHELNYLSINGTVGLTKSGTSVTFYDAHFGPDFQISGEDETNAYRIKKGFFDSREKQLNGEINGKLTLEDSLFVNSSTTVAAKSFSVDAPSEKAPTVTITYRLSEIPYINLGSFKSPATVYPTLVFQYDESDRYGGFNEADFTSSFRKEFNTSNFEVPVVCGTNIACKSWNVPFKSSIPQFNGETSLLEAVCEQKKENEECIAVSLKMPKPSPTQTQQPTQEPTQPPTMPPSNSPTQEPTQTATPGKARADKRKIAIIVGSSAGATLVICIIIIAIFCRKWKKDANLNSQKLLNTTF